MDTIKGKVIVLGDDVDTDQILPGYAMAEPYDQLGNFAMAGLAGLDFKSVYEPGSIIVAGRNFGWACPWSWPRASQEFSAAIPSTSACLSGWPTWPTS